jgi:hypothetical protein
MLNQPSVEFTRQMWWESLTRYYGGPRALATRRIMEDLLVLVAPISCIWAEIFLVKFPNLQFLYCMVPCLLHSILEDVPLTLVFPPRINVPLFFSTFHYPSQREHVQPSLVLSMLALSTLFQSSEIGLGHRGRLKACEFPSMCQCRMLNRTRVVELRDLTQSHFDMSLKCGWVSPDLAQAALVRFHQRRNHWTRLDLIVYLL